jgi:hypothetical protein
MGPKTALRQKGKTAIQWLVGERRKSGALHCAVLIFLFLFFLSLFFSPSILALSRFE